MGDDNDGRGRSDFNRRERYGRVNGEILLIAVSCLVSVVIVVIALHVYARCVLQRRARRRLAIRQLRLGVVASQMNSSEPPRSGLDAAVIASLPIFVYKQAERADNASIECSVCLSVLEEEDMARILPNCKHMFHAECIDIWLGSHSTCPICRTDAEPRAQPVPDVVNPTAPPVSEAINFPVQCSECVSNSSAQSAKVTTASTSRLSSFRRMLSKDRSERRVQTCEDTDLERQ